MALISCSECNQSVSDKAKTCPHCGAQVKPEAKRKKINKWVWIALGAAILVSAISSNQKQDEIAQTEARMSPEQKAAKEAENKAAMVRTLVARKAVEELKTAMRDPSSLAVESIRLNDDSTLVCIEYRARNGFGGMNREFIVMTKTANYKTPDRWNKHCTQKLHDLSKSI
jgi:phage terminase large subunit GpA-like protein